MYEKTFVFISSITTALIATVLYTAYQEVILANWGVIEYVLIFVILALIQGTRARIRINFFPRPITRKQEREIIERFSKEHNLYSTIPDEPLIHFHKPLP